MSKTLGYIGPFIGQTISSLQQAVFFDPHCAISRNRQPGRVNVGATGSGKTRSMFTQSTLDLILGKRVLYIEPKIDSMGIPYMPIVQEATNNIDTYFVTEAPAGSFDPFSLYDDETEARTVAMNTLQSLFGTNIFSYYRTTIQTTLTEYLKLNKNCSLMGYTEYLRKTARRDSKEYELYVELKGTSETRYAALLFHKQTGQTAISSLSKMDECGITLISLMGLDLPQSAKPEQEYTASERIGLTILSLLLGRIHSACFKKPKPFPVSIYIDEFWQVAQTATGKSFIDSLLRLARTYNVALSLASQNPSDFKDVEPHISSWFVFRLEEGEKTATSEKQTTIAARYLGITPEEAAETLPTMQIGHAIFRDADRRAAKIEFFCPDDWKDYFETNPVKKAALNIENRQGRI